MMKAQHRIGLNLSWLRITAVFLIDVAIMALVSNLPEAWQTHHILWWAGVAVALIAAIVGLVTFRRIPLASAVVGRVADRFADPEVMLEEGRTPAVDHHRRYGRELVGVREYRGELVALVGVESTDKANQGRHHQREMPAVDLPLDTVASALREFDVRLDGIDVVSVATRHTSEWEEAVAWDRSESASRDTPVERRTWLVLRFDPQRNVAAIASRDSVASTLAAAAERLALNLVGRRCPARPLAADEFDEVDTAVLTGLDPARTRAHRRRLKQQQSGEYVASYWLSPQDITSETLHELWAPDADATVVTIRVTPCPGGAEISAWVRYHSARQLGKDLWSGLNRLTGRQLAAVHASLPTPAQRPQFVTPTRRLRDGEQLMVPVSSAAEYSMALAGG